MSQGQETERRSQLDTEQRTAMLEYMASVGEVEAFGRVMIEYSGLDRSHTAKIRVNDGEVQFVAKTGKLEDETRKEALIDTPESLEDALAFMAILGYTEAKVCIRNVFEINSDTFNLSVRDVVSSEDGQTKDTLMEVEPLVAANQENSQEVAQRLDDFFAEHNIEELKGEAWKTWVQITHDQIDTAFSYSEDSATKLAESLRASGLLN